MNAVAYSAEDPEIPSALALACGNALGRNRMIESVGTWGDQQEAAESAREVQLIHFKSMRTGRSIRSASLSAP
jgi:hypothetical protein